MRGEIKQRNPGSWQIRVFLGRDKDGKRIRKNETVRGKKADAERRLREILGEMDRGVVPSVQRYKLAEWLDAWLADVISPNKEQKTIDRYEEAVRLHIVPDLGNIEISKITPRHVQELESRLLRDGMAPKGVGLVHNVLGGAMKHALRMELISRDPVALVSPPSVPKTEASSPSIEQVQALLKVGASCAHYLWLCVYLVIYTGMRRGEALGLSWANVDLEGKSLRVEASLVITSEGLELKHPKTESGRRIVDLDGQTVALLREHRSRQRELAEHLGVDPPEMVFPRRDLQNWCHPNTLVHFLSGLAEKAECPGITIRSLRHFHASVALQSEKNPVVVSKRIGHANVSTTMDIYAHALPGWQRETAESVAQLINRPPQNCGTNVGQTHNITPCQTDLTC